MVGDLLYRLRALFGRKQMDAEVDAELRDHLERETEKYRRMGIALDEAMRQYLGAGSGTVNAIFRKDAWVYRDCGCFAGARNRCQHSHLYHHPPGSARQIRRLSA